MNFYESPNDGAAGPVLTTSPLKAGAVYAITVSGTVSAYAASLWTATPAGLYACGPVEPQPATPSPGVPNGKVHADAEMLFGSILKFRCEDFSPPFPRHYTNFQMNTGTGWAHLDPVGGTPTSIAPGHSYTYLVTGNGVPVGFRQLDSSTTDNYGIYTITVGGGETCKKDGWRAYGVFANQGDCVSYFATDGRNGPKSTTSTEPPTDF